MIQDELKLPFRWYDDVLKQNRYKNYCAQNCDFKLITQCDRLLPFQIKADEVLVTGLVQWLIYDAEGNEVLDLSSVINNFITVTSTEDYDYITFKGDVSMTYYGFQLDCSQYYYSMLNDGTNYWFSELFYMQSFTEAAFEQEIFQSFLPWRFYDNCEKANRFKGYCQQNCGFYLLSSTKHLLPFQFKRLSSYHTIDSFYLLGINQDEESVGSFDDSFDCSFNECPPDCGITLEPASIDIVTIGIYDYFIYDPVDIDTLECGVYVAKIVSGGITYCSEPINLTEDIGGFDANFLLQEDGDYILQEDSSKIKLDE